MEFLDADYNDKPILFEIFTTTEDEQECLMSLVKANRTMSGSAKRIISSVLGDDIKKVIKKAIR